MDETEWSDDDDHSHSGDEDYEEYWDGYDDEDDFDPSTEEVRDLLSACMENDPERATLLLCEGEDDAYDMFSCVDGTNPACSFLGSMADAGSLEVLEVLLAAGIPARSARCRRDAPVQQREAQFGDALELLLVCGADPRQVVELSKTREQDMLMLLCHGAEPNATDLGGSEGSILFATCSLGKVDCVELLLQAGVCSETATAAFFRFLSSTEVAGHLLYCAPARGPIADFLSLAVGRRPALLRDLFAVASADSTLSLSLDNAPDGLDDLLMLSGFPEYAGLVQSVLFAGVDADGCGDLRWRQRTALTVACRVANNLDMVELLLCASADTDGPLTEYSSDGSSAVLLAGSGTDVPLSCVMRTRDPDLLECFSRLGGMLSEDHILNAVVSAMTSQGYEAVSLLLGNFSLSAESVQRTISEACGLMPQLVNDLDILFPRLAVSFPKIVGSFGLTFRACVARSRVLLAESGADTSGLDLDTAWRWAGDSQRRHPTSLEAANDTDVLGPPL